MYLSTIPSSLCQYLPHLSVTVFMKIVFPKLFQARYVGWTNVTKIKRYDILVCVVTSQKTFTRSKEKILHTQVTRKMFFFKFYIKEALQWL